MAASSSWRVVKHGEGRLAFYTVEGVTRCFATKRVAERWAARIEREVAQ